MSEIRFESLPPTAKPKSTYDHEAITRALKARPGEWAVIFTYSTVGRASAMANAVKRGRNKAYAPAGSFETATRHVGAEFRVYGRYVGGEPR